MDLNADDGKHWRVNREQGSNLIFTGNKARIPGAVTAGLVTNYFFTIFTEAACKRNKQ
jgi:hypothetical protein